MENQSNEKGTVAASLSRELETLSKINQVAKNLLRKGIEKQPDDFRKLKELVGDRLGGSVHE